MIEGSSEVIGQDKLIEIIKVEVFQSFGAEYLHFLERKSKNLDKISKIYLEKSIPIAKNWISF